MYPILFRSGLLISCNVRLAKSGDRTELMHELIRTNDAVLVSAVVALLESAGIRPLVFDQNMSVLEGSLGVLPRRVLVPDGYEVRARQLLKDAGLGHELRPDES